MGRYYSGDIKGKFWFGIQSSAVPERFGAIEYYQDFSEYGFEELEPIKKELATIKKELGNKFIVFQNFFKEKERYNNQRLLEYFEEAGYTLTDKEFNKYLSEYADWCFGEKVREYMEDNDNSACYIQAEH